MPDPLPARYAYLGPEGTFAEQALLTVPAAAHSDLQAHPTVTPRSTRSAAARPTVRWCPWRTRSRARSRRPSTSWPPATPLIVTREVILPVSFCLLARAGTELGDVRRVATHPHAHAQCRRWLAQMLPEALAVPALSTAAGAAALAEGGDLA